MSGFVRATPDARVALVGATIDDAVRVMLKGPSGVLTVARDDEWPAWRAQTGEVRWPNGAVATVYSAEAPEKLRGPEHHIAWCDELAKWRNGDATWDNLRLSMRLGAQPRVLVTTTPRTNALMRRVRALAEKDEAFGRGRTGDNPYLPEAYVAAMEETYGGTLLGRQELDGELIAEVAGALWSRALSIDAAALDAGGNLAVVGGELLQFGAAAQVAPTRWRLTRLLRARRGLTATHAAGERFTLLAPECVTAVTLPASAIGKTLRVLASGVGDPGAPAEASAAVSGVSVAPPSPVRLAATRLPDGSARLTWVRRSRLGWGWRDGGDAPLGEEREAYRVTIEGGGAARTMVVTTPEALASAAEVAACAEVAVRQVGTVAQSTETRISLD